MTSKEFERIDPYYKELFQEYLLTCPIKVGAIADKLGIPIKVVDMGLNISGQISYEDDSYIIRVNRNDSRERQRFTIAHEIAHFLLHKDIIQNSNEGIKDKIKDTILYRSGAPEQAEYEANRLAADLLMPANIIREQLEAIKPDLDDLGVAPSSDLYSEAKIEKLASLFQVSQDAMRIRLKNIE